MSGAGEWYTAADLAGLPELPGTDRRVRDRARAEGWRTRKATGKKGSEYHVSSLPRATREHLLRQAVEALPAPAAEERPAPAVTTAELAGWQREVMHARLGVCALVDELMLRLDVSANEAIAALLRSAREGTLAPAQAALLHQANARTGASRRLADKATLYRWLNLRQQGPAALAPKARPPAPPPVWLAPLLRLYQVPTKPSVAACLRKWEETYPDIPKPNGRTANRHIKELPAEIRHYGRMGRRALRAVQPFVRRTSDGLWPMDVVTVDGHLFKAYVRHPMTGRKLRPELTTYLDIATRRAIGFSAWLAESQMAIWAALRDMVLNPECGVPALHYSDNGAYTGESHRAVMERIGSTLMFSEPYRAQARGVIERLNSSVWVPLAREFPTYVNDDADPEAVKKALAVANADGRNLMDWQGFIAQARRALAEYNDRPHESLGGRSPNEAWARAVSEGWRPTPLERDDLHDLLPSLTRTVNRGWVSLPWGHYFGDGLRHHHGRRIVVGVHPTDGQRVWCSTADGVLICVAERDGNARPYVPQSMLEDARAKRESGRVRRLERKIEAAREEGAAVYDLPPAEVSQARPLPARREPPQALAEDGEANEYDSWFNSAVNAALQDAWEESIDVPLADGQAG